MQLRFFVVNCRQIPQVIEAIVQLIQQEESVSSHFICVNRLLSVALSRDTCVCDYCCTDKLVFLPCEA